MNYKSKRFKTNTVIEYASVFLMGAAAYFLAELVYRGYSHITMFFAGGICFFLIYICEKRLNGINIFVRSIIYALVITAVEFVFGIVFNIILGLQVWDYSELPFNILGQVCPGFVLMWMALSFPAVLLCRIIREFFRKKTDDNALVK